LDEKVDVTAGSISISPMHLTKGLEFRAVAVMACDDEVLPLQERVEAVTDEADLLEVYETERHLLYVACTRARRALTLSWAERARGSGPVRTRSRFIPESLPVTDTRTPGETRGATPPD
jgi:superfamily I DNA/RNA helicase